MNLNKSLISIILTIFVILISTTLSKPISPCKYYAIESDVRRCAFPRCGGYFLKELNTNSKQVYVSTLVQNGSLTVNEDQYRYVQNYQVIIYGSISNNGSSEFDAQVTVSKFYRYIDNLKNDYNLENGNSFKFYNIIDLNQNDVSIDTKKIHKLNTNKDNEFGNLVNNYDDISLIQMNWLNYKIMSSDALFTSPSNLNNNKGNVTIDHLFIGLPDPRFCPRNLMVINCKNDTVPTYTRSPNRCESFSGCVTRGPCPLYIPQCPNNYRLVSIKSKPHGCNKYYCDPSFL